MFVFTWVRLCIDEITAPDHIKHLATKISPLSRPEQSQRKPLRETALFSYASP